MQEQYKKEIQRLEKEGDVETLEILKQDAEVNNIEGIPELAQQVIERLQGEKEQAVEVPSYQTNEMAEYGGSTAEIQPELDALNQEANNVVQSTEEKIHEVEGSSQTKKDQMKEVQNETQAGQKIEEVKENEGMEEIKTPLGLTEESQKILEGKLPDLLSAAESGKLNSRQAEDLGLSLALKGDSSKINELLANASIGQAEKNTIAKEALLLFADAGNPNEAENLLNHLSQQEGYQSKSEDAYNKENMFSNDITRLQRKVVQSYLDSGDINSLAAMKAITNNMMEGVDRDAVEEQIREMESSSGSKEELGAEQKSEEIKAETPKGEVQEKEQSDQEREAGNIRRYYEERINQANQVIEMTTKRLQKLDGLRLQYREGLDTLISVDNSPDGPRGTLSVKILSLPSFLSDGIRGAVERLIESEYNIFKRDMGKASLGSYIEDAKNASEKAITDAQTERAEAESKMERDLRELEDEMAKAEESKVNSQEGTQG